ncbi:forkhead box protein M1 isoform X3 [Nerophis lumbriciformis]|uniref:forkhead box protein M1 isoform X3 n=1 Tax=Nerophis lumbriciformis TaxID=546530 RepID=UPI002AE045A5|nr:forkhead box protein M1 isoform X3 [Nerophis lumbriciformis]
MRRSPRRPLILKRRKLPFQQNDPPSRSPKEAAKLPSTQPFPDGIRILDHPSLPNTQVVIIPKRADLQSVINALTLKGKERGAQGRNKFILLGESGALDSGCLYQAKTEDDFTGSTAKQQQSGHNSTHGTASIEIKQFKKKEGGVPFDDSLTCMQWLERSDAFLAGHDATDANKENQKTLQVNCGISVCLFRKTLMTPPCPLPVFPQFSDADAAPEEPECEKPPFSYMTMIQFAINSRRDGRMTLSEIYKWLQDHFLFFRDETRMHGWKNSVRHNLSIHNMFLRKPTPNGKVSFWTIRPEANRGLTLNQVYKPGCAPVPTSYATPMLSFPQQQTVDADRRCQTGLERGMKLLPLPTPSNIVPIQLPVKTFSSSLTAHTPPPHSPPKAKSSRKAPKQVSQSNHGDAPCSKVSGEEEKTELLNVAVKRKGSKALAEKPAKVSRRKQHLVHSLHDEPVLIYSERSDFDSGIATSPTLLDEQDAEPDPEEHRSPDRHFSYKTPIKISRSRLTSSTPSKPPSSVQAEPWKVTPLGKEGCSVLDFSPIRTPIGPAVTPMHDYTTFSLNSTPFKDWAIFCSPATSPSGCRESGCSRELLLAGGATPSKCSLTEGLILDTMDDSLSKILVDLSFGLEDDNLQLADVSLSDIIPQLK